MPWFIPVPWNVGDKLTKTRLDRIEQGVADADVRNPDSPAAASLGATYATKAQLGAIASLDNGNGTVTITATGSATATDLGNGLISIAA